MPFHTVKSECSCEFCDTVKEVSSEIVALFSRMHGKEYTGSSGYKSGADSVQRTILVELLIAHVLHGYNNFEERTNAAQNFLDKFAILLASDVMKPEFEMRANAFKN